ncbi:unnamed protein product, partial [Ectocarpus sp. 13 AM-2016]
PSVIVLALLVLMPVACSCRKKENSQRRHPPCTMMHTLVRAQFMIVLFMSLALPGGALPDNQLVAFSQPTRPNPRGPVTFESDVSRPCSRISRSDRGLLSPCLQIGPRSYPVLFLHVLRHFF